MSSCNSVSNWILCSATSGTSTADNSNGISLAKRSTEFRVRAKISRERAALWAAQKKKRKILFTLFRPCVLDELFVLVVFRNFFFGKLSQSYTGSVDRIGKARLKHHNLVHCLLFYLFIYFTPILHRLSLAFLDWVRKETDWPRKSLGENICINFFLSCAHFSGQ